VLAALACRLDGQPRTHPVGRALEAACELEENVLDLTFPDELKARHRLGLDGTKGEPQRHAEISSPATAKGPEQIGVLAFRSAHHPTVWQRCLDLLHEIAGEAVVTHREPDAAAEQKRAGAYAEAAAMRRGQPVPADVRPGTGERLVHVGIQGATGYLDNTIAEMAHPAHQAGMDDEASHNAAAGIAVAAGAQHHRDSGLTCPGDGRQGFGGVAGPGDPKRSDVVVTEILWLRERGEPAVARLQYAAFHFVREALPRGCRRLARLGLADGGGEERSGGRGSSELDEMSAWKNHGAPSQLSAASSLYPYS
jgi:hypothetical protein